MAFPFYVYNIAYPAAGFKNQTHVYYNAIAKVVFLMPSYSPILLAAEIDQLSYDYDTYQYNDTVEDREAQVANIAEDIRNGNMEYLNDFLNAMISDSMREAMSDKEFAEVVLEVAE